MATLIDLEAIRKQVERCEGAAFRDARELARQAAHWAFEWERSGKVYGVADIDILVAALELGEKFHDWPGRWANARLRLLSQQRDALGFSEPINITEINKRMSVEMGCVVFHDADTPLSESFYNSGTENYKQARSLGEFYDVSLGGDGRINLCLRYVDCSDPILPRSELRRSHAATGPAWVHCPSLRLTVEGGGQAVTVALRTQNVLISCFVLGRGRYRKTVCVICDAKDRRPSPESSELEGCLS